MSTMNMVGGGGSGAVATIRVTTDLDATVTATKGAKTVQFLLVSGVFVATVSEYGTWIVTATKGGKEASTNLLVDFAETYEITLSFVYKRDKILLWLDGSDFDDHSDNACTMSHGGVTLQTHQFDKANVPCYYYSTNNSSTYFYTRSAPQLIANGFSVSWWMYVTSKPSYSSIWSWYRTSNSGQYGQGCNTSISTSGRFGMCGRSPSGATIDKQSSYTTPTNTVMHCVTTYNGTTFKLFVNGVEIWSVTSSAAFGTITPYQINIGHNLWNTSVERFMGYMTDIRFYNEIFTATDALAIYNAGTMQD